MNDLNVVMIDFIDAIWVLLQGEIIYRGARPLWARTTQHSIRFLVTPTDEVENSCVEVDEEKIGTDHRNIG